jgi:hypothetical protein
MDSRSARQLRAPSTLIARWFFCASAPRDSSPLFHIFMGMAEPKRNHPRGRAGWTAPTTAPRTSTTAPRPPCTAVRPRVTSRAPLRTAAILDLGGDDYGLEPSYSEMMRKYPGGFNVSFPGAGRSKRPAAFFGGVSDARAVIDEAAYNALLGTKRAYLSGYTHRYKQRDIDGVSLVDADTWFNVPRDRYPPRR